MPHVRSHRHLSGSQTPEIIVYPNRRGTTLWVLAFAGGSLLLFLLFLFILILALVTPTVRNAGATLWVLCLLGLGFVLGLDATAIWFTRVLASLLSSGEPALVISHEGIRVGKVYGSVEIMLLWGEIEAIYMPGYWLMKELAIRPTNVELILCHFGPLMRFLLRSNMRNGAPFAIGQSLLDKPIEEILQQLQGLYGQEVDYYNIQLPPSHGR